MRTMRTFAALLAAALAAIACPALAQVAAGPTVYRFSSAGAGQHNVTPTAAVGLTVPGNAQFANVCATTLAIRYTTDGSTAPSGTVGQLIPVGTCVWVSGPALLANFRMYSATGVADIEYFK